MLPSLENQFISDTYHGLLHTANEPVSANSLSTVYDGDGNASPIKVGKDLLQFGSMQFPTSPSRGTFLFTDSVNIELKELFPVGAVYFTITNSNPSSYLKGTWIQISQGRFIAAVGTSSLTSPLTGGEQIGTTTEGENFGEYENKLTLDEVPIHDHWLTTGIGNFGRSNSASKRITGQGTAGTAPDWYPTLENGGVKTHNNLPPSFAVYMWSRIS